MRNLTIYLVLVLCLFLNKTVAQETFEDRAKNIAVKIEQITKEEKAALKLEVESVNTQLQSGSITNEQADEKKMLLAENSAKNIEARVSSAQEDLRTLVQEKVDGKIKEQDSSRRYSVSFSGFRIKDNQKRKTQGERRTTSQLVFATGFNNLVTNGSIANSDFGYLRSDFFEWGFTFNTRISNENNLLHAKYGLSFMYNILSPTDNRYFSDNGSQTELLTYPVELCKSDTYFKNVFITLPVHLEFDFSKNKSKNGETYFNSHNGFRLGVGGFVGYNTNSKQFLSYEVNGYRINEKQKGNWNVSDFNYGVSTYVGYRATSLYLKYDLNPLFKDNVIKQNNISLGVRFDLN
jgi:hypothetical protein